MHMLSANSPRGRTLAWVIIGDFVRECKEMEWILYPWEGEILLHCRQFEGKGWGVLYFVKSRKATTTLDVTRMCHIKVFHPRGVLFVFGPLNFCGQRPGNDSLEDWEYVNPCHSKIKSNRMVITFTKKTVFFHFILIFVGYLSYPSLSDFLLSFTETLGRKCADGRFLHVLFQYRLDINKCCSFS